MANRIKGITVEIGGDTTEQLQNGEISQGADCRKIRG